MFHFIRHFVVVAAVLASTSVWAASYQLNQEQSSLHFSSVKNTNLLEQHSFTKLDGSINKKGKAELVIDLSSVQTHIDLRDERMRDLFFNVAEFPQAAAHIALDKMLLKQLKPGFNEVKILPVHVELHGKEKIYQQALRITVLANGAIQVTTVSPLYLDVADFALTDGLEHLRELAKLSMILPVVPVTLDIQYQPK